MDRQGEGQSPTDNEPDAPQEEETLSLDRFIITEPSPGILVDRWQELNLHQLDVTMGQKGMQAELQRRFGVDGGYTNTDLRRTTSNRSHPHILADFQKLPFRSGMAISGSLQGYAGGT